MAITTALTNVAKGGFGRGRHEIGDVYKMALYKTSASLNSATTKYLTTGEISGTGYSAGGVTLATYQSKVSAGQFIMDWTVDPAWTGSSFSAGGAEIYNSSLASNEAIAVFDFGSNKEVSNGTLTVQLPVYNADTAVIRIE